MTDTTCISLSLILYITNIPVEIWYIDCYYSKMYTRKLLGTLMKVYERDSQICIFLSHK